MGKSAHKSRKRRRSGSPDRIADLESKFSHLIEVLSKREVRTPHVAPSSEASSSILAHQEDLESGGERFSNNIVSDDYSMPDHPVSDEVSGVYELPNSVFSDRGVDTTTLWLNQHTFVPVAVAVSKHSSEGLPPTPHSSRRVEQNEPVHPIPVALDEPSANSLAKELFGPEVESSDTRPWNELVMQKWRDFTRNGLEKDLRTTLLKKYSVSEDTIFLKAPKLNQECKSALKNNPITKRDEYNLKNQDQLGTALVAFGEAMSDLLKPEVQPSLNPEIRAAIAKIHDGVKILGDLFFRLSFSRRAQIKPVMSLLARNTSEAIPADDLLFGASFGEELKKATLLEKSAKDIVHRSLSISKRVQQPIKTPTQPAPPRPGNSQAPVAKAKSSATRSTGAFRSSRRSPRHYRSRSRRY